MRDNKILLLEFELTDRYGEKYVDSSAPSLTIMGVRVTDDNIYEELLRLLPDDDE